MTILQILSAVPTKEEVQKFAEEMKKLAASKDEAKIDCALSGFILDRCVKAIREG